MKWDCDNNIDQMFIEASHRISDYIEILMIQAISKQVSNFDKKLDEKLIEKYLKRRGYVENLVLGKLVMIKGFICVYIHKDYVEAWHDIPNRSKSVFINQSLLTGLPITLNYMERI